MLTKNLYLLIINFFIFSLYLGCETKDDGKILLFSYFIGNGEDGLHLAASEDGLVWNDINGGNSVLLPLVRRY